MRRRRSKARWTPEGQMRMNKIKIHRRSQMHRCRRTTVLINTYRNKNKIRQTKRAPRASQERSTYAPSWRLPARRAAPRHPAHSETHRGSSKSSHLLKRPRSACLQKYPPTFQQPNMMRGARGGAEAVGG